MSLKTLYNIEFKVSVQYFPKLFPKSPDGSSSEMEGTSWYILNCSFLRGKLGRVITSNFYIIYTQLQYFWKSYYQTTNKYELC